MSAIALLTDELRQAIWTHAEAHAPRECCGLLVRAADGGMLHYMAAANLHAGVAGEDRFLLDPEAWAAAEEFGEILAVVHSHPHASANPSMADRVGCERSGLPWLVMGWPSGVVKALAPEGWQAPYKGREFAHGVLDCYTLIQDWYRRELATELPDFDRDDEWWKDRPGAPAQDLYMQGFGQAGFVRVDGQPQRHDVLLMQVRAQRANHGAIYLGDMRILHHLYGQPSGEDVYGSYWQHRTMAVLRHQRLVRQ